MFEQSATFYPECVECLSLSRFYLDNHHRIHEMKYQVKRGQPFPLYYQRAGKVRYVFSVMAISYVRCWIKGSSLSPAVRQDT